jgi:3-hydroxyacyl-CoA dehydrogenase
MKRIINHVAILGSGIMGSRIACHFANKGVQVLLLDIVPKELTDAEKAKGLSLEDKAVRNRIVNNSLQSTLKSNPSPIFDKKFASRISIGNFEDDMAKIKDVDWIMEVVVERLDIKKIIFDQVEKYRKPGTLVSSNTSGIPINLMTDGRSDEFKKHFCGTHFFNPPRYLKLLEIIPTPDTDPAIVDFLMEYGDQYLGKTTVLAKDTPAFIANRVGIYAIMELFHYIDKEGFSIEEVDSLTGAILGRPKSATFRTCDVVGLDTLVHVANGLHKAVPNDEKNAVFALPEFINYMIEHKLLGDKTGGGFYKKTKKDGKTEILAMDLKTKEYHPKTKVKFASIGQARQMDDLKERTKFLVGAKDKAGDFYRSSFSALFQYVSNRIPEIADDLYKIDQGMKAGFGWELGPFETWDAITLDHGLKMMKAAGCEPATWVKEMVDAGHESFYKTENGALHYYNITKKGYEKVPGMESFIILDHIRPSKTVWSNSECAIEDLGDGILNVEFRSKMNSLGSGVLAGVNKAVELAEKDYRGLVVGNQAPNFTVGANLAMVLMMGIEQEWDELNFAIKYFQDTVMRLRYSSIPVVVAPHGMTLGGGCEMTLHADAVQAAAETYIGLVEFGVGLIPAGAGTKEMTVRASDRYIKDDVELNAYREYYLNIGMAKVATSAAEAFTMDILKHGRDHISMNKDRQIQDAKRKAIMLADMGYQQPVQRDDIKVLGRQALAMFEVGAFQMLEGNYITAHEKKMTEKLAYVMAGGDLSAPTTVSEQYLLDLEREAFLSLCGERKTLERIQHMLKTGKPLRN